VNLKFFYYIKERLLLKIKKNYFFLYQSKKAIYAYKGLIGRFSPMLVHISLVTILLGSFLENLYSYRIQNYFPRGEVFRIHNHVKLENLTKLPSFYVRINDAWPEYKKNIITQFYTNISILDNFGNEIEEKTVLVNHPLFFKNLNFYQTDWNLQSIRVKPYLKENATEYPLFKIESFGSWVTWIKTNVEGFFLILNNFQKIVVKKEVSFQFSFLENLPAAGLFFNFEPTLFLSYFGFAALILTSIFSYFPYNQFWLTENFEVCYLGALTNREKINLDCEFEILIKTIIPPQELSSETSI
jgi:cytochrome c biogenesis protein